VKNYDLATTQCFLSTENASTELIKVIKICSQYLGLKWANPKAETYKNFKKAA
jgi:hypothetical protein